MSYGRKLFEAMVSHGDRLALVTNREELTYRDILRQVGHIAANFRRTGVRAGDYVGLAMHETVETLLGILACWQLSATPIVIDFRMPRIQRAALARDFNFAIVFEAGTVPGEGNYGGELFDPGWRFASPSVSELPAMGDDTSPAFLLFSSGTTGVPKAYVQTHEVLMARISTRHALLDSSEMRFLTPMALTYSATRHQVFAYLLLGGAVRLFPPLFSPSELAEALLAFRASGTALPPPVVARLAREAGERSEPLFPRLSVLASVGGPARPEDKVAAYRNLTPGYRMGYSSSLTGMIAILAGRDILARPEATGRIAPTARVAILGSDGNALPPGEAGLIKAWTPSVASAMLLPGGQKVVDPETMGPDWGIPGDLGFLDGDGFLTLVDRQADVIVRGGVNVAPQEIERVVARHPKAIDVAVFGFPDDTMGQEIAAFIVAENATLEEFVAFIRANVAPDRRPREVRIVRSLPYSEHGKLRRASLVEQMLREKSGSGKTG